jgi:hypothetical protein
MRGAGSIGSLGIEVDMQQQLLLPPEFLGISGFPTA